MALGIVVASRYGSTRRIGETIAEELTAAGRPVTFFDADEVEGFGQFDAVVLGSAIYAGRWLKPARKLLRDRAGELAQRPTWLFSCGPLGDPPMPEDPTPPAVAAAMDEVRPRDHAIFGGRLDRKLLKRRERLLVDALHAPDGDFRDWGRIRAWAASIAGELPKS
jgi:menaquinone-dependent protoporphyrinogen oxidase